jgi:hypothetical protein
VCCIAAGNSIGGDVKQAVDLLLKRNAKMAALRAIEDGATSLDLSCARACPVTAGDGGIRSLCAVARLGLHSPCQQRRAPRVLVRASLARVLRLGIVWR